MENLFLHLCFFIIDARIAFMKTVTHSLKLSEEQALFFRARRGFLIQGAPSAAQCAHDMIGLQSQQPGPGLLALSLRLDSRPTASVLKANLFSENRDLVRTWGQRDTLHIYDAETSWRQITHARHQWSPGGRNAALPSSEVLQKAREMVRGKTSVLRNDFLPLVSADYLKKLDPRIGDEAAKANFACGRMVWFLSREGHLCLGEKKGTQQIYAARRTWFPHLDWTDDKAATEDACVALSRRYLRINAPATVWDLAHFFGATVTSARKWLAALDECGELISVECGDRKELVALAADEADLRLKPGRSSARWPLRLLPLWDTLLMSHKDKSWTVPEESERLQVWRKAAFVSSVVLVRGRVVGLWKMQRRAGQLDIDLHPLKGWIESKNRPGFIAEAEAVARHLQLEPGAIK